MASAGVISVIVIIIVVLIVIKVIRIKIYCKKHRGGYVNLPGNDTGSEGK